MMSGSSGLIHRSWWSPWMFCANCSKVLPPSNERMNGAFWTKTVFSSVGWAKMCM